MEGSMACIRYMTATFEDIDGVQRVISTKDTPRCGWYTAQLDLPFGACRVRVHFNVVGGAPVCRVVRSEGSRWFYDRGVRVLEVFEMDFGDGANVVFRLAGPAPFSYVAEARDFGQPEGAAPRPWEWWAGSVCQEDADRRAYNAAWFRLEEDAGNCDCGDDVPVGGPLAQAFWEAAPSIGSQPGRLRMEGNRTCLRYMTADLKTSDGRSLSVSTMTEQGCGWYTADLRLPVGARDVNIRFHEFGGAPVSKVVRSDGARWAREGGQYPQEVVTFEYGNGVNAVFRIRGAVLRSYVSQAWDFGRGEDVPQRPWEWWCDDSSEFQRDSAMYTVADVGKPISELRARAELTTAVRSSTGLEKAVAILRMLSAMANVRFCRITLFKQSLLRFGSDSLSRSRSALPDVLGVVGAHHEGIVLDVRTGNAVASFLQLDWDRTGLTSVMSDTFPDISDLIAYDANSTFKCCMISDEVGDPSNLLSLLESLADSSYHIAGLNCAKFASLVWDTFSTRGLSGNLGSIVQPPNTCSFTKQADIEDDHSDQDPIALGLPHVHAMQPIFLGPDDLHSKADTMM